MKIDFIADTNFLIYIHEGNKISEPFLDYEYKAHGGEDNTIP